MAFDVPEISILFTSEGLVDLPGASTISIWLIAVSSVIPEFSIVGAILPADWADSGEAVLAIWVANSSILFATFGTGRKRFSSSPAGNLLPARV